MYIGKAVDQEQDKQYGADHRGDELPKELAHRESRLKRIEQAKKALEAEAKSAAEQARKERQADSKKDKKPKGGRRPKPVSDIPADNKQYDFTDPESKIMKVSNSRRQTDRCLYCHGENQAGQITQEIYSALLSCQRLQRADVQVSHWHL